MCDSLADELSLNSKAADACRQRGQGRSSGSAAAVGAGQGSSISPKGYLTSPTGAAKMPFWDAPSEAAEAVRSRTGSVDQQAPPGFVEALAGA